jgi:hypothetical protein
MSANAAHDSAGHRHLCQACRDRKARFRFRGRVRADRDHTLCFQCFRAERDRRRARMLADVRAPKPLPLPHDLGGAGRRALTEAQVAHRRRMLAHLASGRAESIG